MDNVNGALAFNATLNINDFNVSAQAMERRIQQVGATAAAQSAEMETMFGKAAAAFAGIVGVGAAKGFVQQMIQVRSEMQNTEASFKVFLGTASKANEFFNDLQRYAYNNVFEFADLSKQAAQLLAFRNEASEVIPILDKLSNIAAGANAPLGEFVSLYNKAKANNKLLTEDIQMWESRGVPVVYELAQAYGKSEQEMRAIVSSGKVGFKDLNTVITNLTSNGGMFAGMMAEKMKTLGDSIGLLQDNITNMFNSLGAQNQGVLKQGIDLANLAVENYETLGRVLGSLVIAYGTYKAAMVATSLAQKNGTGIAVLDNTVRAIRLSVLKAEAAATGQAANATKAMSDAEKQHLATLQAQLTVEERAAVLRQVKVAAVASLLTAEQQQYLSNLNVTTSSENYLAVAGGVLSADQRLALSKMDLSAQSTAYAAAVEAEVAAKNRDLAVMRQSVKEAAKRAAAYKETAIAANEAVEAARYEVYWAQQSGDAVRIAVAEKKLEAAEDNAAIARKAALGAQSEFYAQKKGLEAAASKTNASASLTEAKAETVDTVAKNANTKATSRLTVAVKGLWTTIKANPLGWIISILGTVVALFNTFRKSSDETATAAQEFEDTTRRETQALKMYFGVLQNTEKGTNSHKDALQKINTVCKQYNQTLMDENTTLDQQKQKYEDLTTAIMETAKAKVMSANVELINREAGETEEDALKKLKKQARKAKRTTYETEGESVYVNTYKSENIRNAPEAIWDLVGGVAKDGADKLKNLAGEEYEKAFAELMENISARVKSSTEASDEEMQAFSGHLKAFVETVVEAEVEAKRQIDETKKSIDAFYESAGEKPDTTAPDYMKMTFQELDAQAADVQKQIDEINKKPVKVDTDTKLLDELQTKLGEINKAVSGKTADLDTESGISARVKELKDLRSQAKIGSKEYENYTKQINSLQKKLPKSQDQQEANQRQYSEKALAAQRETEEARIAIMEDGAEKQRALLELQHKRNLDAIEKDRKDLEKAKKKSGKGGLSKEENQMFHDRTDAENTSYTKEQNKLVDSEIEYRKQQYQLYWKWVDRVGKDAADKQFASLVAGGASYSDWVNKQIGELTTNGDGSPKDMSSLNETESTRLVALTQEDERIKGTKSAMDQFSESLSHAMQQAGNLAEKLEVIADFKDRLSKGEFHLNADETASAAYSLGTAEADTQTELNDELLNDFQTFEEQKASIQAHYETLRNEAVKEGNAERLALVNQGEAEALSSLNASMLMQTDSWKNLFGDLDSLTVSEIDKLVKDIQTKMNSADLNLNPSDMKAVLDRLDEAKKKILDVNPFKALGSSLSAVFKKQQDGSKKSAAQIKTDWSNLASATEGCFDFVNDAIDSCDVLGDLIGEDGKATISMIQGVATAGIAMSAAISTAEKGSVILTAISIALQAIQWIATLFDKDADAEEHIQSIQKSIDGLSTSFDRLQSAYEKTYWEYSPEEREANKQRVKAVEDQIAALEEESAVALATMNVQRYVQCRTEIEKMQKSLEEMRMGGDMMEIFEYQKENLRQQQELIKRQIEAEQGKKKSDSDKIDEYKQKIQEIDDQIAEMEYDMLEKLAGIEIKSAIDEFGDALVEAYERGENAADALGAKTKEVLKNAVVEALKRQYLAKGIEEAVKYLGTSMEDGFLSDDERTEFERMVNEAGESFYGKLDAIKGLISGDGSAEQDALQGAVASLSEETGGVIAGRLNAVVINQAQQTEISRQSLMYQAEIAANTRSGAAALADIQSTLRRIENRDSSLLSQGIS